MEKKERVKEKEIDVSELKTIDQKRKWLKSLNPDKNMNGILTAKIKLNKTPISDNHMHFPLEADKFSTDINKFKLEVESQVDKMFNEITNMHEKEVGKISLKDGVK